MWQILNPEDPDLLLAPDRRQLDFATSPAFATLAAGGWGSGKTFAGLAFVAISAWSSPQGSLGLAVLPSYPMMKEWLEEQFLPAFSRVIMGHNRDRRVIYLPGGRKLLYRSGHVPTSIQMSNVAYVYLDEPHLMRASIWSHVVARARKRNTHLRIGLASLPKIGWLSKHFDGRDDTEYRCLHFETADNHHVSDDYVRNLKRACPASMLDAYLRGRFVPTGGAVWPEYMPSRHVIPWRYNAQDPRVSIGVAIDWSPNRPHVLFIARVPAGYVMPGGTKTTRETSIVVDEIYPDGHFRKVTTRRLCEMIKRRCPPGSPVPWPVTEAIVDPAGGAKQSTSGESDIIQAKRYLGVPVLCRYGERIRVGVQHVQLALDPIDGDPFLFFAESLQDNPDPCAGHGDPEQNKERSILRAMQGYSYPDADGASDPDEPFHDSVFSHAADALRYWVRYYYPADRLSLESWSVA